jgi:antitoxin component YwqK of YwqJK toxin-antitoxin module
MNFTKFLKTILLLTVLLFTACKTNQTVKKEREGRWVYRDTINAIPYKSTGRYKNGIEQQTWRYYANEKRVKKEKYRKGICYTTTYFENGKTASTGKTKMTITDTETHWYYFGDWLFYDKNGKLISIKNYIDGELVKETKL